LRGAPRRPRLGPAGAALFYRKLRNRSASVKESVDGDVVVKSVKLIVEFAIGAVIGVAILTGLLVWRLSGEPLSLSFLTPYLEKALSAEDGSFTTRLDDTVLTWEGWKRAVDIRLRGVRAIGPDGKVIASVPDMAVALSFRGLLHGVVAPTSLEIFHPKVRVVRGPDGKFNLGVEEEGPGAGDILTRLITDLLAPPDPADPLGYLTSVRITRADLTLVDEKLGTAWHAPEANVVLARGAKGITGQASLGLDVGGQRAEIDADVGYDRDARKIDLGLSFGNISPARLAAKQKLFGEVAGFAVPLSGTLTASLDLDGGVESFGFDVSGGPGKVTIPKAFAEPLPVTAIALHGRAEDNLNRWVVDRLHADLGGPVLDVSGHVFRTGTDLAAQGEAIVTGMPVDSLMRYWPATVAVNARTWIRDHISHGDVHETRAVFAVQAPRGDLDAMRLESMAGTFDAKGLTVAYLPPMPPVENVSGRATFTSRELDVAIKQGTLAGIHLTEGKVAITGLDVEDQDASIDIVLQGPLGDLMQVLDSEPVGAAKFLGIAPADIGGQAAVRADFRLPLEKDLKFAQLQYGAAANVRGASIKQAALHQDLTDGALTVKVDRTSVTAEGTARLGGVPASIAATVNYAGAAPFASRYAVTAQPDDADLARFGFPLAPYIVGRIPLSLALVEHANGAGDLQISADLAQTAMDVPEIAWSKPKGTQGTARIALTLDHDRPAALREFSVTAGNLTASGNGAFAAAQPPAQGARLQRVDFSRLAFGRTDVAGRLTLREGGGYDIQLRGPQIDAASYFSVKDIGKPKEKKGKTPPLSVTAVADTLWVGPEAKVLNASLALDEADDRWRRLDFQGALPNPKPGAKENQTFRVTIEPLKQGGGRHVVVATGDAGLFLRSFGVFDDMLGGALNLDGTIDDAAADRPFAGRLLVKDYRITRTPFLAKLLTVASLTGILNVLSGEGIGFTDLKAPLTLKKDILTVTDARAYGPDIGLTMEGTLNIETKIADLQGTVVPAYAINTILGNIPIVGDILTGGKGSGVFAATYKLTGNIDDPDVDVNPLAALTPGVLRNIFDIFEAPPATDEKPPAKPEAPKPQAQQPQVQQPQAQQPQAQQPQAQQPQAQQPQAQQPQAQQPQAQPPQPQQSQPPQAQPPPQQPQQPPQQQQ